MAMASAVAIGATVLTGSIPALAAQTNQYKVTNGGTAYWMWAGAGGAMTVQIGGGGTLFTSLNGTTKSINGASEPVVEWKVASGMFDVGQCWTFSPPFTLSLSACVAGKTSQLFWGTTSPSHHFVNVAASNMTGVNYCVNATHAVNGDAINVIGCKTASQPGSFDQVWTT
jgi:hypothetical protein